MSNLRLKEAAVHKTAVVDVEPRDPEIRNSRCHKIGTKTQFCY